MQDISGFGLGIQIIATNTFPIGLSLSQFADDSDPLDLATIQIADDAMGLNGDLINWASPIAIPMAVGVIPGSDDDRDLAILFEANRTGRGKRGAKDIISGVVTYPDGSFISLIAGYTREYMPGKSVASSGRFKSKIYIFRFENKVEAP